MRNKQELLLAGAVRELNALLIDNERLRKDLEDLLDRNARAGT